MVRGIANSKIGFGDLILLLRYFFKLKVSTHPNFHLKQYEIFDASLSDAGRFLCIGGKQIKPLLNLEINTLISEIQGDLFKTEEDKGAK